MFSSSPTEQEHTLIEGQLLAALASYFRLHGVQSEPYTQQVMAVIDGYVENAHRLSAIVSEATPQIDQVFNVKALLREHRVLAAVSVVEDEF